VVRIKEMISPGRDDNYPTSSGNFGAGMGGIFSKSFQIDGMTISVGLMLLVIVALVMWGVLKK
jgi:hypothetical protein